MFSGSRSLVPAGKSDMKLAGASSQGLPAASPIQTRWHPSASVGGAASCDGPGQAAVSALQQRPMTAMAPSVPSYAHQAQGLAGMHRTVTGMHVAAQEAGQQQHMSAAPLQAARSADMHQPQGTAQHQQGQQQALRQASRHALSQAPQQPAILQPHPIVQGRPRSAVCLFS